MRQKHLLDHHTVFLECTVSKPSPCQHNDEVITVLPEHECIVHCQIERWQKLHVLQPRFERGKVSKCVSNTLQLSVYVRSNLLLFLPGQIEIHDIFESAPYGRILSVWHNDQRSSKSHAAIPTTVKTTTKAATTFSNVDQSAKRNSHSSLQVHDNKQHPARSAPSSSDHNQDAVSPLPTEVDATGSTSQDDGNSPKYANELSSPCHSTFVDDLSKANSAVFLQKSGVGEGQVRSKEEHTNPDILPRELNYNQELLLSSKECTIGKQFASIELNEKMQVDEGAISHATDKTTHTDSTTSLLNSHQPVLTSNTEASPKPEPPKEDVIIPASLGKAPQALMRHNGLLTLCSLSRFIKICSNSLMKPKLRNT